MPKSNRNKKRDENHNCKAVPSNRMPVNKLSVKSVPVSDQPVSKQPVNNQSASNQPVSEHLPANNLPVSNSPDNNLPLKHPLNSKWALWYYLPEKNKDWEACQHQIHTVTTVEDFWSFFNHLAQPSELLNGVDFSFFKNGIRPMWEAPQNVKGGRLTVINTSKCRNIDINEIWLDILLFLIGEYYEYAEDICGVVLNVRNYGIKLAIWTTHQDKERLKSIGSSIRQSLTSTLNQAIPFEVHAETQRSAQTSGRASSKNVFTV
ncbi:eukaryotic translation initiation factor 4E-like [Sitodiplosis mosellana]|uniref:eukaryotic translation initiation factor 4E-like n=1 Tax=Sitodiplosis mosellana TaxID=263140 RepID=UPI0024452AAD|nr:eukaryotic translation initiation factor 4E-like [Sitodiplosis mosellana]